MCAPVYVQAQVNVLFINPSIQFEPFWHKAEEVTKAAADDLELHLDIIYGGGNRLLQLAELKAYLKRNPKPDYVIFMNYPSGAKAGTNVEVSYLYNLHQYDGTPLPTAHKNVKA